MTPRKEVLSYEKDYGENKLVFIKAGKLLLFGCLIDSCIAPRRQILGLHSPRIDQVPSYHPFMSFYPYSPNSGITLYWVTKIKFTLPSLKSVLPLLTNFSFISLQIIRDLIRA